MSSEADAHGRVYARPAYSAHTIATIVVYVRCYRASLSVYLADQWQFNPAKTLGNMTLALRYCFFLVIGSSVICVCAMGTLELFDVFSPSQGSKWDWISEMGDWIVCVLWVGGSLGGLAWLKLWVGNPSFNSGKCNGQPRSQWSQWGPAMLKRIRLLDECRHHLHGRHQRRGHAESARDAVDRLHRL